MLQTLRDLAHATGAADADLASEHRTESVDTPPDTLLLGHETSLATRPDPINCRLSRQFQEKVKFSSVSALCLF